METMATKGLVLLTCWVSPYGMRVQIALEEKSVAYELKMENLMEKSALLLQSNPVYQKVPVLIHDGTPVCESLVILHYVDETFPNHAPLLPADPYARSQARFWADFADRKIFDCGNKIWKSKAGEAGEAKKEFIEGLKVLEGELGEKEYFGGEALGLVDVTLVPLMAWFYSYEQCGGFSVKAEAPKLMEWGKRCLKRESVAKAIPDPHKVYEFICCMRKRFGLE